jgi:hypothetical protein
LSLFSFLKSRPSADELLLSFAEQQRWSSLQLSALSMLPPSHAKEDIHGLRLTNPPTCGGRAFASSMGERLAPLTISHLEMSISDTESEVYDALSWSLSAPGRHRLEIEVGASAWNHHRLAGRFDPETSVSKKSPAGPLLRCSRAFNASQLAMLQSSAQLLSLRAFGDQLRSGFAIECEHARATLFTRTTLSAREPNRWQVLLDAARCTDDMLLEALK